MCIAFFHWSQADDDRRKSTFVVCHNRDEYLARPTQSTHWWPSTTTNAVTTNTTTQQANQANNNDDSSDNNNKNSNNNNNNNNFQILAPRDLQSGGTWIGLERATGRCAFVTNIREAPTMVDDHASASPGSRGNLVLQFLMASSSSGDNADDTESTSSTRTQPFLAMDFCRQHGDEWRHLAGFNLILFSGHDLVYVTNRPTTTTTDSPKIQIVSLQRGVPYGISNTGLERPYEKVTRGLPVFAQIVATASHNDDDSHNHTQSDNHSSSSPWYQPFSQRLLSDPQPAPPEDVPNTPGFQRNDEATLSSIRVPIFSLRFDYDNDEQQQQQQQPRQPKQQQPTKSNDDKQHDYGTRSSICFQITTATTTSSNNNNSQDITTNVEWMEQELHVPTRTWQEPTLITSSSS